MTEQLSSTQALIGYGIGGAVAFAGFYNQMFLAMGIFVIFIISIFLTFFGGG